MKQLEPGQNIFGGYRLVEFVADGGFGSVWKAVDTALDREVAIKFINRLPRTSDASRVVVEEGQRLSALSSSGRAGSEYIVYVNRAVVQNDEIPSFLDIEWMSGGSLATLLKSGVPLEQEQVIRYATQLAWALSCAHKQGVIHCDIKPGNILLSEDSRVCKLSDFGLARRIGELIDSTWGTPAYMSPEQFHPDGEITPKTDVYGLGVVLFQCFEGHLPYKAKNLREYEMRHCQDPVPMLSNPGLSEDLKTLVADCMRKEASSRPATKDVLRRLQAIGNVERENVVQVPNLAALDVRVGFGNTRSIVHRHTKVEFAQHASANLYVPMRPMTNRDFYRFLSTPDHRHWSPSSVSLGDHDGGYLQHWFMAKPSERTYDEPVTSVPYPAAREFAKWMGGDLPSSSELNALFLSETPSPLLAAYRAFMEDNRLDALQFWCRDRDNSDEEMACMWRLLPDTSPLRSSLSHVCRPPYYCFPHYVVLVLLSGKVADLPTTYGGQASIDGGPPSQLYGASGRSWRSEGE